MSERLPIKKAAERLGISSDTVRRRMKKGELVGEKIDTPQGFEWRIVLPIDEAESDGDEPQQAAPATSAIELELLRERIDELKEERDAWKEQAQRSGEAERELRILLRQAQELALPERATPQDAPGAREVPSPISGVMHKEHEAQGPVTRLLAWVRGKR